MIALLLAASLTQVQVREIVQPEADRTVLAAVVMTGDLTPRQRLAAQVVADTLLDGTTSFHRYRLREYGAQTGDPIRVTYADGHFRIRIVTPRGQHELAATLLQELVQRGRFEEEAVKRALIELPFRTRGFWEEALRPVEWSAPKLTRDDVVELYQTVFRPDRLTVVIRGGFEPGAAQKAVLDRLQDWQAAQVRRRLNDPGSEREVETRSAAITTISFDGPPVRAGSSEFPARLLATLALGVGHGGGISHVAREGHGMSYRQEALLWPAPGGLRTRLIVAKRAAENDHGAAELVRGDLVDAVQHWNASDLQRAKGLARGILLLDLPISPFYLGAERPLLAGRALDGTELAAVWYALLGQPLEPARLVESMEQVTLEELQQAARDTLAQARVKVVTGRR
jgi:hypothetical protein